MNSGRFEAKKKRMKMDDMEEEDEGEKRPI